MTLGQIVWSMCKKGQRWLAFSGADSGQKPGLWLWTEKTQNKTLLISLSEWESWMNLSKKTHLWGCDSPIHEELCIKHQSVAHMKHTADAGCYWMLLKYKKGWSNVIKSHVWESQAGQCITPAFSWKKKEKGKIMMCARVLFLHSTVQNKQDVTPLGGDVIYPSFTVCTAGLGHWQLWHLH